MKNWLLCLLIPVCLILAALLYLSFADAQSNKYVFMFQRFVYPKAYWLTEAPTEMDYQATCQTPAGVFASQPLPSGYTGTWRGWDEEGNLHHCIQFKDGYMEGKAAFWEGSGVFFSKSVYTEGVYVKGKLNGPAYHINLMGDTVKSWGNYRDGRREGVWKEEHNRNGVITVREVFYKNGMPVKP